MNRASETKEQDWLTTADAAEMLSVATGTFYSTKINDSLKRVVRHRMIGDNPRFGWLWLREDIELIVRIRQRYELRTQTAIRAIRNGLRS